MVNSSVGIAVVKFLGEGIIVLNFELSEKRRIIRDSAAKFAQKEILPVRDQFEADYAEGKYVDKIFLEAAKVGLLGFPIEEKFGGSNGNNMDIMVILEELAAVDGGVATAIGDTWFAMTPIIIAANSEQRERFLKPLASRTEANLGRDMHDRTAIRRRYRGSSHGTPHVPYHRHRGR